MSVLVGVRSQARLLYLELPAQAINLGTLVAVAEPKETSWLVVPVTIKEFVIGEKKKKIKIKRKFTLLDELHLSFLFYLIVTRI